MNVTKVTKPKSAIWCYYNRNVDGSFTCKYCKNTTYKKHATRMKEHFVLCKYVPDNLKGKFQKKSKSPSKKTDNADISTPVSGASLIQDFKKNSSMHADGAVVVPKLKNFFDGMSTEENEKLQEHLTLAMLVTGCPFSMTTHELWINFFQELRPSFKLPTRQSIADRFVDLHYVNMEAQCATKISQSTTLHLQIDGWSNIRNESIINFIITTPQPLYVKSLEAKENRHTGEYLAEEIGKVLTTYGVNNFVTLIGDNAANIQKAFQIVHNENRHIIALQCAPHTLNLLCGDLLKDNIISSFLTDSMEIITTFRKSQILSAILKTHSPNPAALLTYSKTRWGSVVKCLKSLIANEQGLKSVAIDPTATTLTKDMIRKILDIDFWDGIKSVVDVFDPIVKLICDIEGDGQYIHILHSKVEKAQKEFEEVIEKCSIFKNKSNLKKLFASRKSKLISPIHFAAAILNPNDKGFSLLDTELIIGMQFISTLCNEWRNLYGAEHENDFYNIMAELAEYRAKSGVWANDFLWECTVTIQPLAWWKGICTFSKLSKVAEKILSAPVSSAATERSFSTYSLIHTQRRNKLKTEKASKVTYISHNWKLLTADAAKNSKLQVNTPNPNKNRIISNPENSNIVVEDQGSDLDIDVQELNANVLEREEAIMGEQDINMEEDTENDSISDSESEYQDINISYADTDTDGVASDSISESNENIIEMSYDL